MKVKAIKVENSIYLIDETAEIKEGDYMLMKQEHSCGRIRKCWYIYGNNEEYNTTGKEQLMIDDPKDPKRGFGFLFRDECWKIIATNNPELNLPNIDPEIISLFVKSNGSVCDYWLYENEDESVFILENSIWLNSETQSRINNFKENYSLKSTITPIETVEEAALSKYPDPIIYPLKQVIEFTEQSVAVFQRQAFKAGAEWQKQQNQKL